MIVTSNKYNRADSIEFAKKVSRKIQGWYNNDTFHDKAPRDSNRDRQNKIKGKASMLAIAVWAADKLDASKHPAGTRHRQF